MALAYTKDFLLDAVCFRYKDCWGDDAPMALAYRNMLSSHYDKVGKDAFRIASSLDAAAIKEFKLESGRKS